MISVEQSRINKCCVDIDDCYRQLIKQTPVADKYVVPSCIRNNDQVLIHTKMQNDFVCPSSERSETPYKYNTGGIGGHREYFCHFGVENCTIHPMYQWWFGWY